MTNNSCQKGDEALFKGNIDEAIKLYTQAIDDKANEVLYLNRAFAYKLNADNANDATVALRFVYRL